MASGGDGDGAGGAADAWRGWEPDADDARSAGPPDEPPAAAEVIPDFAPASAPAGDDAAFAELLRSLRAVPGPCAPPIGAGAFDILYASVREIVVWYSPAKDGAEQREVAIPARLARSAWAVLRRGEPVDEAALRELAAGAAGGRWLLALFAQLPTVEVRAVSASDGQEAGETAVTLRWRGGDAR